MTQCAAARSTTKKQKTPPERKALMSVKTLKSAIRRIAKGRAETAASNNEYERKIYTRAELQRAQAEFESWRQHNPSRPFMDYYSENVKRKLAEASSRSNVDGIPYQRPSGARVLKQLIEFGLRPSDSCVDYGCATLRVGLHVIKYLGRGGYWGLDISDCLFGDAKKIAGPRLMAEKEPRLREISPASVEEVAASEPDMLFSVKVMQHVHPDELAEYVRNVMTIIGRSGQAIIGTKWIADKTVQYRPSGWAHSISALDSLVAERGGRVAVLKEREMLLPLQEAGNSKVGVLRIAHKSATF